MNKIEILRDFYVNLFLDTLKEYGFKDLHIAKTLGVTNGAITMWRKDGSHISTKYLVKLAKAYCLLQRANKDEFVLYKQEVMMSVLANYINSAILFYPELYLRLFKADPTWEIAYKQLDALSRDCDARDILEIMSFYVVASDTP